MAKPAYSDDNEDKPLDPEVEKVRRRLVRFMLINFGLLFVALMAVGGAIVYKVSHRTPASAPAAVVPAPSEAPPLEATIMLPAGARIASQSVSDDRISIYAELSDGSRAIFLYDAADGHLVARYAVADR